MSYLRPRTPRGMNRAIRPSRKFRNRGTKEFCKKKNATAKSHRNSIGLRENARTYPLVIIQVIREEIYLRYNYRRPPVIINLFLVRRKIKVANEVSPRNK